MNGPGAQKSATKPAENGGQFAATFLNEKKRMKERKEGRKEASKGKKITYCSAPYPSTLRTRLLRLVGKVESPSVSRLAAHRQIRYRCITMRDAVQFSSWPFKFPRCIPPTPALHYNMARARDLASCNVQAREEYIYRRDAGMCWIIFQPCRPAHGAWEHPSHFTLGFIPGMRLG